MHRFWKSALCNVTKRFRTPLPQLGVDSALFLPSLKLVEGPTKRQFLQVAEAVNRGLNANMFEPLEIQHLK